MKISEFRREYCEPRNFVLKDILLECIELIEAVYKLDLDNIKEEVSDVFVFIQCYFDGCIFLKAPIG